MVKNLYWFGKTRNIVQRFAKSVRIQIGYQLYRVQQGLMPTDWKPLSSIGSGAIEIRFHKPYEHRVVYVAKFQDKIYVLHAFKKKTQKTSKKDIKIALENYKILMDRIKNFKLKE